MAVELSMDYKIELKTRLKNVRKQSKMPKIGTRGKNTGHQCNYEESDKINDNFVERTVLGEPAPCDTTSTTTSNVETEVASNGREVDNGKEENEIKDSEDDSTAKKA